MWFGIYFYLNNLGSLLEHTLQSGFVRVLDKLATLKWVQRELLYITLSP